MANTPSVFISYSRHDREWKDRFVRQLKGSVQQGHFIEWNDQQIGAGEDWHDKITVAMEAASVGVFLVSAEFLASDFINKEEVTTLIRRRKEAGLHIVPVYLRHCDVGGAAWLTSMQMRPSADQPVVRGEDHIIDEEFSKIAKEIRLLLEKTASERFDEPKAIALTKPPDLTRLPRVGEHLFGRDRELALLDGAWADEQTNIISLVAWGGVGKSALVKHWLAQMAREKFRGAARVYGWSFFSQGAREGEASADEFFGEALRWFGEPHPEKFQQNERARRLAELIQQQRTLLILDGLEPLQHPPGPQEGQLKDQTLAELLRLLAWQNPGLVVITTRVEVDDIRELRVTAAPMIELGRLAAQAGAELLQILGVQGEQEELEAASSEFGGHGLALNLLGTYLRDIMDGDVRRRGEVSLMDEDAEHGGHARRIMRSYEQQFGGSPELAVLHLIGLFDRPAKRELVQVLRRPPMIESLNDKLVGQSDLSWKRTLTRLRQARLLSETPTDEIDAHPLVREYFGVRLRTERPDAWRAGHGRLYERLRDSAKPLPETLVEMAPLFQAIPHGCQAERHQEVYDEVYSLRIRRRNQHYQVSKLGAFGADLASIAAFFEQPWHQPSLSLNAGNQAWLLNQAAFNLRALGRLREAVPTLRAGLERRVLEGSWHNAAISAGNMSKLHLALGDVAEAVAMGETSLLYAKRSKGALEQVISCSIYADALHQAGQLDRALALFEEAEALQAEAQPDYPRLYSLRGYQYCDLLLAQGHIAETRERASQTLKWSLLGDQGSLLDIALDHMSLGRAALALGEHGEARAQIDQAVDGLRQSGVQIWITRGLVARAALFRDTGDHDLVRRDLDEAMRIAKRSEMRLFQCDAHLEYVRLLLTAGNKDQARKEVAEARRLVDETGYGRRRPEVEAAEAEVR